MWKEEYKRGWGKKKMLGKKKALSELFSLHIIF